MVRADDGPLPITGSKDSPLVIDAAALHETGHWHRIAVVIDGAAASREMFDQAMNIAIRHRARLTVVAVASPPPTLTMWLCSTYPVEQPAAVTARAAVTLSEMLNHVPAEVPCTTLVRYGSKLSAIRALVRQDAHDVVVLAFHTPHWIGGAMFRRSLGRLEHKAAGTQILLLDGRTLRRESPSARKLPSNGHGTGDHPIVGVRFDDPVRSPLGLEVDSSAHS
jgi:Universal stress protein family